MNLEKYLSIKTENEASNALLSLIKNYIDASDRIIQALNLIKIIYKNKIRLNKDPASVHPIIVACLLASIKVSEDGIIGGLLHEIFSISPVHYDKEFIKEQFGEKVLILLENFFIIHSLHKKINKEVKKKMIIKIFFSFSDHLEVILITLANKMHNLYTMEFLEKYDRKQAIAQECLDLYSPLCDALGMFDWKIAIENKAFKVLYPNEYAIINNYITKNYDAEIRYFDHLKNLIKKEVANYSYEIHIDFRIKHPYSIFQKSLFKNKSLEEIHDIYAMRIYCNTIVECYALNSVLNSLWQPLIDRYKDYIALPKANGYQSLHSSLIDGSKRIFEVQIRTWEMHNQAEYGVAAHLIYKKNQTHHKSSKRMIAKPSYHKLKKIKEQINFSNNGIDANNKNIEGKKLYFNKKRDVIAIHDFASFKKQWFSDHIFLFTPKYNIIELPKEATILDFAYAIHTAIGHKCMGAEIITIDTNCEEHMEGFFPLGFNHLKNGQIIKIITNPLGYPRLDWLEKAYLSETKQRIRQFLKIKEEENTPSSVYSLYTPKRKLIELPKGSTVLDFAYTLDLNLGNHCKGAKINKDFYPFYFKGFENGQIIEILTNPKIVPSPNWLNKVYLTSTKQKIQQYLDEAKKNTITPLSTIISIKTIKNTINSPVIMLEGDKSPHLITLALCCNPQIPDPIIGYVRKTKGITIHRANCPAIKSLNPNKIVSVYWIAKKFYTFDFKAKGKSIEEGLKSTLIGTIKKSTILSFSMHAVFKDRWDYEGTLSFNSNENLNSEKIKLLLKNLRALSYIVSIELNQKNIKEEFVEDFL